jgi:hypothetical protein
MTTADSPSAISVFRFNLKDDPSETQDLAPTQPEKVKTLRALLDKITRSDRDALPPKDP